ncbi:MAG TPA: HD domain-containing phosphohydrolase [Anaerolineales bacterium]|nr:HD domain-containing phosphohydrolase [Anaerolineales bacterium]
MRKYVAERFARLRATQVPILTQITVPYVILAIFTAAIGTFLISRVVVDSVQERFVNQLIETGFLAEEGVVRHEEDLIESLRLLSHIQGVDEAVVERDVNELRELTLPAAYNAGIEALVIVDNRGIAIISLALDDEGQFYRTMVPGNTYAAVGFLKKVLAGEVDQQGDKFGGLVSTSAGPILFVAGPVHDANGSLVGAAMVGRSLTSLVRDLRQETLGQFTVYDAGGLPLSSTLQAPSSIASDQALVIFERQAEGSVQRPLTDTGISYSELLTPFEIRSGEDLGLLGIALPTNFVVQTSSITRNNTFALMSVVLLLVIVVGTVVARRITRPIQDLKDAALRVSGGDLGVQVSPKGHDEVSVLTQSFNEMVENLSKSKQDLLDTYDKTIEGWARALDLRDHETEGHSRRVADLAVRLGSVMGLEEDQLQQLWRGALLHDIGKIAVSDEILLKKGELTSAEWIKVRRHPEYARRFMEKIEFLGPAMAVPYSHHERWDGRGYPQGLKGKQIPLLARIFAVVDVWDALTSDRPYRKALSGSGALSVIRSESGKQFDPQIADAFIKLVGKKVEQTA